MTREFRVLGPPGTGKTSYTARQVEQVAASYGAESVILASFTRTAASELAGRGLSIPKSSIGTLHAHAFRALRPDDQKILTDKHVAEWNALHPAWATKGGGASLDEPADDSAPAEEKVRVGDGDPLAEIQLRRNRLEPEASWPGRLKSAASAWRAWKAESGFLDFTDLLEMCLLDVETAPGNPTVGFLDEAQDSTPLQLALWRKWGEKMDTCVLVGDDDQCLYTWTGASPDGLLYPELPEANVKVLSQSWRVPRAVHAAALNVIGKVKRRVPKVYQPTAQAGACLRVAATWRNPRKLVQDIARLTEAGERCMVLASCSYMLRPLLTELRDAGVPFWNPYRRANGEWNPLAAGSEKRTTVVDRLRAWFRTDPAFTLGRGLDTWTWEEVGAWAEHLEAKAALLPGGKAALKDKDPVLLAQPWDLLELFEEAVLERAIAHDFDWFLGALLEKHRGKYVLPLSVAAKWGKRAVIEPPLRGAEFAPGCVPWTVVGTIHSVKGGEADHVWIFPDLSFKGAQQWKTGSQEERDYIRRLFYVALTRSRNTVRVCEPADSNHYEIWRAFN